MEEDAEEKGMTGLDWLARRCFLHGLLFSLSNFLLTVEEGRPVSIPSLTQVIGGSELDKGMQGSVETMGLG